eukprot:SAG22_NODE_1625_length_3957_cov_3.150078_3_plen_303_part_00
MAFHPVDMNFNRLEEPHQRAIARHIAGQKGNSMMLTMLIEELQRATAGDNGGDDGKIGGRDSLQAGDKAWLCALFSGEGLGASEKVAARDKFFAAVVAALCLGGDTQLTSMDPAAVHGAVLADAGASFFAVLAEALVEQQELERGAAAVSTKAKDAELFTFGSQKDFEGGLQGMIGYPQGLNEQQWIEHMLEEHCKVDPGNAQSGVWGASDRAWTTGNYSLETTPAKEWKWTVDGEWDGQQAAETAGAFEKDAETGHASRENTRLRRTAVPIDTLNDEVADSTMEIHMNPENSYVSTLVLSG